MLAAVSLLAACENPDNTDNNGPDDPGTTQPTVATGITILDADGAAITGNAVTVTAENSVQFTYALTPEDSVLPDGATISWSSSDPDNIVLTPSADNSTAVASLAADVENDATSTITVSFGEGASKVTSAAVTATASVPPTTTYPVVVYSATFGPDGTGNHGITGTGWTESTTNITTEGGFSVNFSDSMSTGAYPDSSGGGTIFGDSAGSVTFSDIALHSGCSKYTISVACAQLYGGAPANATTFKLQYKAGSGEWTDITYTLPEPVGGFNLITLEDQTFAPSLGTISFKISVATVEGLICIDDFKFIGTAQ